MNNGGVDICKIGPNGPILLWLVQSEEYDKAKGFLDAGADIDVPGIFAMMPVIWAASSDD